MAGLSFHLDSSGLFFYSIKDQTHQGFVCEQNYKGFPSEIKNASHTTAACSRRFSAEVRYLSISFEQAVHETSYASSEKYTGLIVIKYSGHAM